MEKKKQLNSAVVFPLVGLGASAGGLEAIRAFFEAMPVNSGMSLVVVQHLAQQQNSILNELIQRHTRIKVVQIIDKMRIQNNLVYVLPAGYELRIEKARFRLSAMPKTEGWPQTINIFFQSLALHGGTKAAAVILSGAGHDGTEGARAVKEQGGLVIAQDLETATQNSMPFSVIDAGLAAAILAPSSMPAYLLAHFQLKVPETLQFDDLTEQISEEDLKRIVQQLRRQTGQDFSDYKFSTMRRQIARRMGLQQLSTTADYLEYMKAHANEADQLMKALLIHVTSFFRDPEAFETLKANALLPLLKSLSIDDVFRVWVPGCASGEEAVTLAILIYECLRELNMLEMEVRIFATDMNRESLQRARTGTYPQQVAEQISAERLKDHFIRLEEGYQVRAHLSRIIVWAEHNLVEHPPFSAMHLISCRNVMIYFQAPLQERVRALFQFALKPGGILFLGSSEAMPLAWDLFTVLDSKHKIYQRIAGSANQWMHLSHPLFLKATDPVEEPVAVSKQNPKKTDDPDLAIIREMLLSHYNGSCAIVDEAYHVRYSYGEIDRYLRHVPGRNAQQSILNMAREALTAELTIALYEAFNGQESVIREVLLRQDSGEQQPIRLIVKPILNSVIGNRHKLLIFEPIIDSQYRDWGQAEDSDSEEGKSIRKLRKDFQQSQQALQTATQALQANSEEISTSMEEISAINEEIQTTNEELRTSKEELESMNEELNTLNTQLTHQNQELNHANNVLYNFLQTSASAVIFLDRDLAVREYTQAATKLFSLRKSDIGRPLAEIRSQLAEGSLINELDTVLDTLIDIKREILSLGGDWYQVEVRPYRTINHAVDGLVLNFNEISLQKQVQQELEDHSAHLQQILDTLDNSLLELDSNLRVVEANAAFYKQFRVEPHETIGYLLYELGNGQWDIPDLRRLLTEIIPEQHFVEHYIVRHDFPDIGPKVIRLNARKIDHIERILLVISDLSNPE